MRHPRTLRTTSVSLLALLICALLGSVAGLTPAVRADEGMWLLNNPPKDLFQKRYGFTPTEAWLNRVMKASVRMGSGGSGSIVSPRGLLMTNHHVARGQLAKLSTEDRNLLEEGFLAGDHSEELRTPDLEVLSLQEIVDVTTRVRGAPRDGMTPAEAEEARKAEIAEIEAESRQRTGLYSDVVTLYGGGMYHLYRYKRYTDVRLVFAPSRDVAAFGGDIDNFEFPRWCLDAAFLRLYENGRPAETPAYLPLTTDGVEPGDPVFVSGHPGRTQRLFTTEHLRFLRDVSYPNRMDLTRAREVELLVFGAENERQRELAVRDLQGVQNVRKGLGGKLRALQDPGIFSQKVREEAALQSAVEANSGLREEVGDAWDMVSGATEVAGEINEVYTHLEAWPLGGSRLFDVARDVVRYVGERDKPAGQRLEEYAESNIPRLELLLYSPAPIHPELEEMEVESGLALAAEALGGEHPAVQLLLDGKSPAERARELVRGTDLAEVSLRRSLVEGGEAAIDASDDPMIRLATAIEPLARAVRERQEDEVEAVLKEAYARLATARFEIYGDEVYPDATFSLRLSAGTVKGFEQEGEFVEPFTTFAGMYERREMKRAEEPFELNERWMKARSRLDLSTPYNFVSTNDIIGGNSGSPTINADGEVVGLIFDGNRYSFVWDAIYTAERGRAVSVDVRSIIESLRSVYRAESLVNELLGD